MTYLCTEQATKAVSHEYDRTCDGLFLPVSEADETSCQAICMVLDGVVRGGR